MNSLPTQRQELILKWLQEQQTLTIEQLCQELGVSIMTIHRDLDQLVQTGLVEKVHGGVTLAKARGGTATNCQMCGMTASARSGFIIHTQSGETLQACCPHCGLMLLQGQAVKSALAADFIYCRMINVLQAVYVIESRIVLCCSPSVLCFAEHADAVSFQAGFGGQIANYADAQRYLSRIHQQAVISE